MDGTSATDGRSDSPAAQAQDKAQQTAQQVTGTASSYVREQAETRGRQAAQELQSVAEALRRSSDTLRRQGNTSAARGIDQVTDRFESLGGYLGGAQGDQMLRDIEAFGRRKPWAMVGLGLGIGLAASRFLKASSSRRYEGSMGRPAARPPQRPAAMPSDGYMTGEIPAMPVRGA